MTGICMDYWHAAVERLEGGQRSIFKLATKRNVMAHHLRENAGLLAPAADGPTSPESRADAPLTAPHRRSDASARRDTVHKPVSRLPQAPVAEVGEDSHEAEAPPFNATASPRRGQKNVSAKGGATASKKGRSTAPRDRVEMSKSGASHGKPQSCGDADGSITCKTARSATARDAVEIAAAPTPTARDRVNVEKLMLVAGLMDDQLELFTARAFGVDHSKLRRLADKDRSLIPVIGRRG